MLDQGYRCHKAARSLGVGESASCSWVAQLQRSRLSPPTFPTIFDRQLVAALNNTWCGDITYVWAQGRRQYLAVALDLYRRRVLGLAMFFKADGDLVIKVFDRVFEILDRSREVPFHCDQGSQQSSRSFRQRL
ncbi:MAG: DDE-type integrase/transposase/recombinase [Pseudomonas sp.]|uniref:DDE-type integrase/transposase/recombinase n=1 Tax=Pseudomonas sp. TaxID=306 RepID=UPI003D0E9F1D